MFVENKKKKIVPCNFPFFTNFRASTNFKGGVKSVGEIHSQSFGVSTPFSSNKFRSFCLIVESSFGSTFEIKEALSIIQQISYLINHKKKIIQSINSNLLNLVQTKITEFNLTEFWNNLLKKETFILSLNTVPLK